MSKSFENGSMICFIGFFQQTRQTGHENEAAAAVGLNLSLFGICIPTAMAFYEEGMVTNHSYWSGFYSDQGLYWSTCHCSWYNELDLVAVTDPNALISILFNHQVLGLLMDNDLV